MPFAELKSGVRLHYVDQGRGRPLVLLHGFTLDHRQWSHEIDYFSRTYRVIAPDALGHGLSDAPETGYSRGDRVRHVQELVEALDLGRFHLLGLSMGGTTAIGYALEHAERLRTLILVSTGVAGYSPGRKIQLVDNEARNRGLEAAREKWKRTTLSWYKDDLRPIRQKLEQMMDEHSGAIWMDPMRGKYHTDPDLDAIHRIQVPTLILAGELDRIFLPLSRLLADKIHGSERIEFGGVGHMLNLEAPTRFCDEVEAFLDRHSGNDRR